MKKILSVLICIIICVGTFAGCGCENKKEEQPTEVLTETATQKEEIALPFEETVMLTYASGAGAWSTLIYLSPDGTFTGYYSDTDMGSVGEGYDATCYECEFYGSFKDIEMTEDYAFTMTIDTLESVVPQGTEWIEDSIRYVASEPVGMTGGESFIFYLPSAPVSEVSEDFLFWKMGHSETDETLGNYGLYNVENESGFFAYE